MGRAVAKAALETVLNFAAARRQGGNVVMYGDDGQINIHLLK